jgi:phytoene synthase
MRNASRARNVNAVDDAARCRAMLRDGSRTFFAASLVLPAAIRGPATALYAFCRMADDAIDHGTDRGAAMHELRARLDLIYQGCPGDAVCDRVFADAVSQHAIPKVIPLALLEGFGWDAENRRYENISQVIDYAVRVAGTVGLMMSIIMGVRESGPLARACDLGVAMQLTNIARDVGEDARNGRLYLPLQWMREADLDPQEWLAQPVFTPALAGVVARLLTAADVFYRRSESGLCALPRACRPGMYAARHLYAEIGNEVARRNFDSVGQRAVVAAPRKLQVLVRALAASLASRPPQASRDLLPDADWLISAIGPVPEAAAVPAMQEGRVIWLINLFERLERREHSEFSAS